MKLNKRERIWFEAWKAVAGLINSEYKVTVRWADDCLRDFDERFVEKEGNTFHCPKNSGGFVYITVEYCTYVQGEFPEVCFGCEHKDK